MFNLNSDKITVFIKDNLEQVWKLSARKYNETTLCSKINVDFVNEIVLLLQDGTVTTELNKPHFFKNWLPADDNLYTDMIQKGAVEFTRVSRHAK